MMGARRMILFAAALVLAASCRVHEWPDASTPAQLDLELVFATDMPDYKEVNYETKRTRAGFTAEDMDIRYTLKFYPGLPAGGYSSSEASDYTIVMTRPSTENLDCSRRVSLPEGRWKILCWTDYVRIGGTEDLFYETADFSSIALSESHIANTDYKDAFRGSAEVELRRLGSTETPAQVRLDMERPLAKYRFIATDLDALVTKVMREKAAEAAAAGDISPAADPSTSSFNPEDYYIRFYYNSFMPCVFNIFKDKPVDSRTGVTFDSEFIPISTKEVLMGFDYVLVNGHESAVSVQVALCEVKTDKQLSLTPAVLVPLVRSKVTTVRGDFLTMGIGSGIGVNPEFDGEFNLIIP